MNYESVEKAVVLKHIYDELKIAAFNCFAYIVFIFCIKSQLLIIVELQLSQLQSSKSPIRGLSGLL